jgi:hypothetical protein
MNNGNPGGTTFAESTSTGYTDVGIAGTISTNVWSSVQTIPFPFNFYGGNVNGFKVSANGLLTFKKTVTGTPPNANGSLPNASLPDSTVAVFWDEFTNLPPTGSNDLVYTFVTGASPNRQLWVYWFSFEYGNPAVTFQYNAAVLEETSNNIYIVDVYGNASPLLSSTVGVQLNSTTAVQFGSNVSQNANGITNADNDYYQFTPKLLVNNNVGVSSINAPSIPFSTGSQNVNVTLSNYGINAVSSTVINWSVNGTPQTPFNFGGTLAINKDTSLTIGTYNFIGNSDIAVWSSLPNGNADAFQANDTSRVSLKLPLTGAYTINSLQPVSSTNFQNFTTFSNYINSYGISGPVTVNVVAGSGPYLEQVIFRNIIGSSATNTIEVIGNGNTIMYAPNATDKRIVGFSGSKYIKLKNLIIEGLDATNGFGIHMMNNSSHIVIDSCTINLSAITSTTALNSAGITSSNDITSNAAVGRNANNIMVSNSRILGGSTGGSYYGIRFNGSSAAAQDSSIQITNNEASNFYNSGIYLADIKKSYIEGNDIHRANRITVTTFAGITTSGGCESDTINANSMHDSHGSASSLTGTSYGIFNTSNDAGASTPNLWLNNIIYNINSNGTTYGIYNVGSDNQYYIHNTVSLDDAASTAGIARGFFQTTAATGIIIQNNNISITRGGSGVKHGLYFGTATSTITSNYNNVYVNSLGSGAQSFGYENATNRALLSDWQLSSYGANSISADPTFINSSSDFTPGTPALNNVGLNLGVPSDFYGNPRSATPDIGAIEFVPPSCLLPSNLSTDSIAGNALKVSWSESGTSTKWEVVHGVTGFTLGSTAGTSNIVTIDTFKLLTGLTPFTTYDYYVRSICSSNDTSLFLGPQTVTTGTPLSGAYTINSTAISGGTNFQNFTSFTNALNSFGVSGPVTVNVVSGSGPYLEQVIFTNILGSTNTNTIEINGNGNKIVFAPNATDKRVVGFDGSKYIKLKNLTIEGIDATYGFGIHMMNQTSNIIIDSCTIDLTANTNTTTTNSAGITSSGTIASNATAGQNASFITVSNTRILGGTGGGLHYGIRFNGTSAAIQDSVIRLLNNEVADYYSYGIYLDDIKKSYVEGNDIHRMNKITVTTLYGIYTTGGCENDTINANSIHDSHGAASSLTGSSYGIYNSSNDASATAPNLWLNNIIYNINSNGLTYAIYNSGSDNQYYIHNTISLDDPTATAGATRGFYQLTTATGIIIQNNNISITKGGTGIKHGLYFGTAASTITSNYNNIYLNSAGSGAQYIGYLTTNRTTLADWQTAGFGANSITADPFFTNVSNNLTPTSAALNNTGANLGVPSDFYGNARGTTPDIGAIEFIPPTCLTPSNQLLDSIASTAAKVSWLENGTATQWRIEYGVTGFTLGTGMSVIANATPSVILTGLSANTTYQWYVKALCSASDSSGFSGPASFFTGYCQVSTTNSGDYISSLVSSGANTNVSYTATSNPAGSYSNETAQILTSFATGTFDITTTYVGGSNGVKVWVDWNNDLIFDDATELIGYQASTTASKTISGVIPASTPLGNYRMRVRAQFGSTANPPACGSVTYGTTVDFTVAVTAPPACLAPTALALDSIATTSAKVSWTENGTAAQWEIEYDTAGFAIGTGRFSAVVNTNTFRVLTGLTANTTYDWYVKAICSPTTQSTFTGSSSFTTSCNAVSVFPFFENFETTSSPNLPNCWSNQLISGTTNWKTTTGSGGDISAPYAGTNWLEKDYNNSESILYSPAFDLTAVGTNSRLNVWLHRHASADVNDQYIILINNSKSLTGADTLLSLYSKTTIAPTVASTGWYNYNINIPSTYNTSTGAYIMFVGKTSAGFSSYDLGIDNYRVEALPACLAPSAQSLDSIASTAAKISWTEIGTATQWEIEYDTAGFAIGTGRFSAVVNTNTFKVLTGLTANKNYQWYVKSICSPTAQSTFTGPSSFYTGYCIPAPTSVDGTGITNVTFGSVNNTTGAEVGNYGNYTALIGSAGQSTTLAVNITFSTGYTYETEIWVDWNNDLDFLDAGENVYSGISTNLIPTTLNASFLIPTTAALGNYRMRVGAGDDPVTSCYTGAYASFEDYTLNVTAPPSCIAPSGIVSTTPTATTANITWIDNNSPASPMYQISYGAFGFTAGNGMQFTSSIASYSITGLTSATNYQVYVRAICGAMDTSSWSTASSFTTPCATYIAPYFDNVEAHTATTSLTTSLCWTATDNNSSVNDWNITGTGTTPSGGTGPLTAYSGSKFFYFEASGGAAGNRASLTSPLVNISGLTVPSLEFYFHMFGNGLAVMADLYIEVYNGTSFVIVDSIKGEQQLTQAEPFKKKLINLSGFSGTIQVKFTAVRNGIQYGDISIDDIRIAELPNCFAPSALVVSAITTTSATISWTGNNTPVSTTYQISYGPLGFTAGSGLKYTSSTNSYAITGLNSSTPYDVYVRSICNVGDTSVWSIARSFTTSCAAFTAPFLETFNGTTTPLCWSQSAVLDGPWVFGGPGFAWNTQGCPFIPTDHTGNSGKFAALDFSGSGVTDVVLEMPEVDVSALTDPQLEFYFAMCGTGYTPINILYVDAFDGTTWNNVGLIQRQTNGWEKFTFKLGAFKYNTNIVRVRFRASSGANTASMFQGDQAIDDVAIVQAPADNLAVSAIVSPVGGCGQTATSNVTITIDNVGSAAQSGFGVGYSLNGVAITPEIHTASIAANSSANYTFTTTANLSASGNYQIVAYTLLVGDVNLQNDTTRKSVTSLGSANSFPYTESFENGAAGWVADGNANSTWALGTPTGVIINSASNGTKAWVTNLTGDYLDGGIGSVNSPCFDFTNVTNPAITLDIWYDIESQWDGAIMQTSIDNGTTWSLVGAKNDPINWYNDTADVINALGLDSLGQAWTGDGTGGVLGSGGWIKASHYLNGMAGLSNVRVRILFAADGGTVAEGFAFDNVRVFDSVPVVSLPYYPIGIVNTENSTTGIADSLGVFCWISGTVAGVDLDGNVGISFTIIDQSGTNPEGMNIYNFADVSNYVVTEGDSIMLRGEIQQFNGLTELFPDSIRIIATGKSLPAHTLVSSLSEATESQLIEIRDFVVITPSGNGSYNFTATNGTDTLTIRVDADTDVNDSLSVAGRALVAGDTICSMKGIGGQFDNSNPYLSGYQIFPMRFSDIDTTSCITIIGIKDAEQNTSSIQFYPNPNNGQFKLQIENVTAPNSTLEIVNIQGQVVYNENLIINGSLSKDININVEKGIYFVKLSNRNGVKVEKLIID